MTLSLILALIWVILANVIAFFPSRKNHWPSAVGLILVGVPLLGYVTYENGPWVGLLFFFAGASMLRWPLFYLFRWIRRVTVGGNE